MIIKTSELEGAALDYAVAKAVGENIKHDPMGFGSGLNAGFWVWGEIDQPKLKIGRCGTLGYSPSNSWAMAGPMIDARVSAINKADSGWWAHSVNNIGEGTTALIACCRAIVAAELGETVDVPEELIK